MNGEQPLKPTDILACFFATVANEIGNGNIGNVSRAVLFIRGEQAGPGMPAIVVTYPIQSDAETITELEAALAWMRDPEPESSPVVPSHPAPGQVQ